MRLFFVGLGSMVVLSFPAYVPAEVRYPAPDLVDTLLRLREMDECEIDEIAMTFFVVHPCVYRSLTAS